MTTALVVGDLLGGKNDTPWTAEEHCPLSSDLVFPATIVFFLHACPPSPRTLQVHARGSLYASPDELLSEVTGDTMRPGALVEHLRNKYSEIYGLQ